MEKNNISKEPENTETARDKGVSSTDLLSAIDLPCDRDLVKKIYKINNASELLKFIRDYELYPEYYDAHPGRKEYIALLIEKIDRIL